MWALDEKILGIRDNFGIHDQHLKENGNRQPSECKAHPPALPLKAKESPDQQRFRWSWEARQVCKDFLWRLWPLCHSFASWLYAIEEAFTLWIEKGLKDLYKELSWQLVSKAQAVSPRHSDFVAKHETMQKLGLFSIVFYQMYWIVLHFGFLRQSVYAS